MRKVEPIFKYKRVKQDAKNGDKSTYNYEFLWNHKILISVYNSRLDLEGNSLNEKLWGGCISLGHDDNIQPLEFSYKTRREATIALENRLFAYINNLYYLYNSLKNILPNYQKSIGREVDLT